MSRTYRAVEIAQTAIFEPVNEAVNPNADLVPPRTLYDWCLGDTAHAFDNVKLGESVTTGFLTVLLCKIHSKGPRKPPNRLKPVSYSPSFGQDLA